MDEVIPSDHPRRVASRVIQIVWPHTRDVILYARSSYYYDNMFIIILFLIFFLILKPVLDFNPEKLRERLPYRYVSCRHVNMFSVSGPMLAIYFT